MKALLITTAFLVVLFPSTTVLAGNIMQTQQNQVLLRSGNNHLLIKSLKPVTSGIYQNISQQQHSRLSLSAAHLKQPHILSINTTKGQLSGKITVNGVVVKTLKNSKDSINLSPYLAKGKRTIEISAKSVPSTSAIRVEFTGPGTRMTQEMKGSGLLRQTFVMDVY